MRVYLGSRYSRLEEMRGYAVQLRTAGAVVDAQWLSGEFGDLVDETAKADGSAIAREAARHDVHDVTGSDIVVIFTDPPEYRSKNGRGGFHVEFGIALGTGKKLLLVGHRINSFHHHPNVEFFPNWEPARDVIVKLLDCQRCGTTQKEHLGGWECPVPEFRHQMYLPAFIGPPVPQVLVA